MNDERKKKIYSALGVLQEPLPIGKTRVAFLSGSQITNL